MNSKTSPRRRVRIRPQLDPADKNPRPNPKTVNATPQEQHSQRLTSASLSKQDATSGGTVRNERCYKVQSRRHKQAPQHEPDKSTPVAQTPPVPLSKGWTNVRESGRRRPSKTNRARLQHQPGTNRAMEDGTAQAAALRVHGLATWADAGIKGRAHVQSPQARR